MGNFSPLPFDSYLPYLFGNLCALVVLEQADFTEQGKGRWVFEVEDQNLVKVPVWILRTVIY